jgi:hypothetical protein
MAPAGRALLVARGSRDGAIVTQGQRFNIRSSYLIYINISAATLRYLFTLSAEESWALQQDEAGGHEQAYVEQSLSIRYQRTWINPTRS